MMYLSVQMANWDKFFLLYIVKVEVERMDNLDAI
jgi:hypothetical protein